MESSPISSQALPAGTRLEEFVIEQVLGSGGFGITYLARDTALGRQVVIKENLPVQFCFRDPASLTVAPRHTHGDEADNFRWSLENFSKEAAMLASLDHPGIVKVLRSFQAFGTAYFVMPFVEGVTLDELLVSRRAEGLAFSEEELRGMLERTLSALAHLHDRGIYHRDIKPGNILVTNDGIPVLIDFGSARQRLSERSMTVVESAGYTPFEQLQSRGNVGPWSDLYALAATLVKVMTGEAPPKTNDRSFGDPWQPLLGRENLRGQYSEAFLAGIDRALKLPIEERWQDAAEWARALRGEVPPWKALASTPEIGGPLGSEPIAEKKRYLMPWILVGVVVLGWLVFGQNSFVNGRAEEAERRAAQLERENIALVHKQAEAEAATAKAAEAPVAVESLSWVGSRAGEEREFEIARGVKMTFCWCPPGEFTMGSPTGELGRESDENQVEVTLSKGFWLAKTEVTQGQWKAAGGIDVSGRPPAFWDGKIQFTWEQFSAEGIRAANFEGGDLPLERVDWNEVRDWCLGMTERLRNDGQVGEGWKLALPTEAQWEYACRAGTNTALNNGRNLTSKEGACRNLDEVGWYDQNSGKRPHAVGTKKANAWGLHDMHGNVWEWSADWYGDELAGGVDPQGAASGVHRALRGGSWDRTASCCRAANRFRNLPGLRYFYLGFRPALVPSK